MKSQCGKEKLSKKKNFSETKTQFTNREKKESLFSKHTHTTFVLHVKKHEEKKRGVRKNVIRKKNLHFLKTFFSKFFFLVEQSEKL